MIIQVHEGPGGIYGLCEDPANLPADLGPWRHWKDIDVQKGDKPIGVDIDRAIDDIQEKGYHLTKPRTSVTETVVDGGSD